MVVVWWILGGLLLLVFGYVAVLDFLEVVGRLRGKDPSSMVPLIGGLCGMAGVLVLPHESIGSLWWLPLFLDVGCVPWLVWVVIWFLRRLLASNVK